jgi:hypothetical protein
MLERACSRTEVEKRRYVAPSKVSERKRAHEMMGKGRNHIVSRALVSDLAVQSWRKTRVSEEAILANVLTRLLEEWVSSE